MSGPHSHLAPHVQAAIQRTAAPSWPARGPVQASPAPSAPVRAHHVQASMARPPAAPGGPGGDPAASALGYVAYTDQKTPTTPPPPPRWPVYSLHCGDRGGCRLQDVRTGRWREPGSMYAGFVRMNAGGPIYVSPRPDPKVPGDSHPTIASGTPEGQAGKRALIAAGEVGIVDNRIVGHNDKTGHYRTRKNLRQSGMPAELFHPWVEDPAEWYGKG